MKIDNTNRRAWLALAMDTLVRGLNDEDAIEGWLMNGVPDGTYDEADESAILRASEPYRYVVEDMSDKDWNDMCSCFIFTMMRGCFGNQKGMDGLSYENGSIV